MKKIPDEEFLAGLGKVLKFLIKKKRHDDIWIIKKLVADNQFMAQLIENYKKERLHNEQGN